MRVKVLLTVLVFFGLLACKKGNNPNPDKKLKSVTGYMLPSEGPDWGKKFVADQEVYDEEGRLISSIKGSITSNDSTYFYPLFYSYNAGRLSGTKDNGSFETKYLYDNNNLVSEMDTYNGDNYTPKILLQKEVYTYDTQNRRIKKVLYNYQQLQGPNSPPPSTAGYTYTFEYNADNLVSKQIDQGGTITSYDYDGHKNLTKVSYSNPSTPNAVYGNETYAYKYDGSGNITEIIQSDYNGQFYKISILYDEKGNVKIKTVYKNLNGVYAEISTITYTYQYY